MVVILRWEFFLTWHASHTVGHDVWILPLLFISISNAKAPWFCDIVCPSQTTLAPLLFSHCDNWNGPTRCQCKHRSRCESRHQTVQWWKWKSLSCVLFCEPMDCSMPGLPVHHQFPECTQTHVHWIGDAIQPSHPLSSPAPPAFNLSQHQGLFQWVSSPHQVPKVLEFQLQHQSFQWIFRTDFL